MRFDCDRRSERIPQMKANFDYSSCNVFVAGGTSGINLGIARAFAAAGARLGVGSRKQEKVDAAAGELASSAGPGLGYVFDVRDADAVAAALAAFAGAVGPIDVLVSGAAGNFPAAARDLSPNGFKAVVDIDLIGTFHVMRAAYPHMRRPGGSIINISAPQAFIPMSHQIHVCAAKAGVDMVTRCLAIEWAPEGLRVNGVVPGPIDGTEGMARLAPTPEARAAAAASVPMKRLGQPDDVAGACLYLGSSAAAYVNGAILGADGGWALVGAPLGTGLK
jgi:NAD(P)-dependent dehydrogenase (short-subunit alcohol dehydrogenase family)